MWMPGCQPCGEFSPRVSRSPDANLLHGLLPLDRRGLVGVSSGSISALSD